MNRLSFELVSMIVEYLQVETSIAVYACVSRQFQYVIERCLFKMIKIENNELPQFAIAYSDSRRRSLLAHIVYRVELAASCSDQTREDLAEEAANKRAFEDDLRYLLACLRHWKDDSQSFNEYGSSGTLTLAVHIHAPMDKRVRLQVWDRGQSPYIELSEEPLAINNIVTNFELYMGTPWRLHPRSIIRIISAMTSLVELEVSLDQPKLGLVKRRREHRDALASGLSSLNFAALGILRLDYHCIEPRNHSFRLHNLVDKHSGEDNINLVLHKLSQTSPLEELRLSGPWIISPSLLWPAYYDSDSEVTAGSLSSYHAKPHWPRLKYLSIDASIQSPDGRYFYHTNNPIASPRQNWGRWDSDESDTDSENHILNSEYNRELRHRHNEMRRNGEDPEHEWRKEIDPNVLNPLVLSMARAARNMPVLRRLTLQFAHLSPFEYGVLMEFLDGGERLWGRGSTIGPDKWPWEEPSQTSSRRWKVWVGADVDWQPTSEIEDLWKDYVGSAGLVTLDKMHSCMYD